jgi:predicted dehydrogenase
MMENSGGMLVHKSTHHFDAMNWILDDEPVKVAAIGNQSFYGHEDKCFAEYCRVCPKQKECPSYFSQTGELDEELYFKAQHEDGYLRDKCCYKNDTNIYDNMSVSVLYKGGALLTYSLNLFSLKGEGQRIVITGENGVAAFENGVIKVYDNEGKCEIQELPKLKGRHGGADPLLVGMLMAGEKNEEDLGQLADSFAGITSALIGISANESIATGKHIDIAERLDKMR